MKVHDFDLRVEHTATMRCTTRWKQLPVSLQCLESPLLRARPHDVSTYPSSRNRMANGGKTWHLTAEGMQATYEHFKYPVGTRITGSIDAELTGDLQARMRR